MISRLSITAFAILALASCVQNIPDPVDPEPMVFSAVASHSTKGIISTTNYPVDVPFVVQAVYYPMGTELDPQIYIEPQTVTFDHEDGNWKTGTDYFWPEYGKLHFIAGSPVTSAVTISAEHGVEADWNIASERDALTDLCFAEVSENCANHSATIPLVFIHALSQVCFKARTIQNYSTSHTVDNTIQSNDITVVLDSVKVRGIVSKGRFTQDPLGWETDESITSEYVVFRSHEGLELRCDRFENPVLNTLNTMLFIPQTLLRKAQVEEWHHITSRTSVTDATTGEIVSDLTYSVPGSSVTPLADYCTRWFMDYKYTFRLAVGLENTELTAAVTDWTETKEIILGDE